MDSSSSGNIKAAPIPIWIDCDTGHDDAFALLLASHPRFRLLGVSTVFGNAALAETTRNTIKVLDAICMPHVQVCAGAAKPWVRERFGAEQFHGQSGLAGLSNLLKPSRHADDLVTAVQGMRNALMNEPYDTAWLVATGPLTNVADLLVQFPEVGEWINGISIMGGAVMNGYTDAPLGKLGDHGLQVDFPSIEAEFNIWCDPHAAATVLESAVLSSKITLATLDLTHQILFEYEDQEQMFSKIQAEGGEVRTKDADVFSTYHFFDEILRYNRSTYLNYYPTLPGPPLHDPVAVLLTLPEMRSESVGERWNIAVHISNAQDSSYGRTVLRSPSQSSGCWIPKKTNRLNLRQLLLEALRKADELHVDRSRSVI